MRCVQHRKDTDGYGKSRIVLCAVVGVLLSVPTFPGASWATAQTAQRGNPELIIQTGHAAGITAIAFAPGDRLVASASADHTIKIWNLANGLAIQTLMGLTDAVTAIAFSPDGKMLVSADDNNNVKLWDVTTGRALFNMATNSNVKGIFDVAFEPGGQRVVSLGHDYDVIVWDVSTGQKVSGFRANDTQHSGLFSRLTSDGRQVISHVDDLGSPVRLTAIELWDVTTGRKIYSKPSELPEFYAATLSPDGRWLAFTDHHKAINVWDVTRGVMAYSRYGDPATETYNWSFGFAFSPDGKVLAVGDPDKEAILLLDSASGQVLKTLKKAPAGVASFSNNGRMFAAISGRDISIFDSSNGNVAQVLHGYARQIGQLALSANSRIMALQNADDNSVHIWDLSVGIQVRSFVGTGDNIGTSAVALSADGALVAAATSDPSNQSAHLMTVWETATGKVVAALTGFGTEFPTSASFSPDGTLLAAGDFRGDIKVWDIKTRAEVAGIEGGDFRSNAWESFVAFSPNGRWLAASGHDSVALWDTTKRVWAKALPARLSVAIAFSPDSKYLASTTVGSHEIHVTDVETGGELPIISGVSAKVNCLAFSPEGHWLATGGEDDLIHLYDVTSGQHLHDFTGHGGEVKSVAFTHDGKWLISAGAEGTVRIWDPSAAVTVAILGMVAGSNDWAVFTPQGLFDGSPKGTEKLVAWRVGDRILAASQYYSTYSSPGLLAQVLTGTHVGPVVAMATLKLPPTVHVEPLPGGGKVRKQEVSIAVDAHDEGGGIGQVRLYLNGKLAGSRLGSSEAMQHYSFDIKLVPGQENVLRAIGVGVNGVESAPDEVSLFYQAPAPPRSTLYVMVVGINDYEDRSLHLDFARPDAEALARFFQSHGNLFNSVTVLPVFNPDATRIGIQKAFDELAQKAKPEDVVLIYYAGHGVLVDGQYYFLPQDMKKEADPDAAAKKYGISASVFGEDLAKISATKQVFMLDACQSESALPALAKAAFRTRGIESPEERAVRMLAHANGLYLIAATTAQQYAYEVPELGHGVFTYALLAGLGDKGAPQAASSEGTVTVISLINYVVRTVPQLTVQYHMGEPQVPTMFTTGTDIPLVSAPQP